MVPQQSLNPAAETVKIIDDRGKGRTFVVLFEAGRLEAAAERVFSELAVKTRTVLVQSELVNDSNWESLTLALQALLKEIPLRQVSFVALGDASVLVQNLALLDPKFVRTIALIDAVTRAHPSRAARLVDKIESALPLGLPLRLQSGNFDGRPFLQRIRCPVLVVSTSLSSAWAAEQAELLAQELPVAWKLDLKSAKFESELVEELLRFEEVPAKVPMKNR